ncbi:MAG TPA: prephenate dehydrogenase [Gemmataceae bacterium]|nr:prephenate dehydrogenase [Gemmataceae bacterium]
MQIGTLTIVGVGLIGGSIGLAARRRGLASRIRGVGWKQTTLDEALARGAIDEGTLDLKAGVAGADVVVFCTPVAGLVEQVLTASTYVSAGTLLTDAGSTKAVFVRGVEGRLPAGVDFVGSHPLAGSEKRGPAHADGQLFEGRLTIVTRTPQTAAAALERTTAFWQALGSRVRVMSPEDHDAALAVTSHLPHLVAATLAGILPSTLVDLTATGFRDTTRVAAGDPNLWCGIFQQNREALLTALTRFRERLQQFQEALEGDQADVLMELLEEAHRIRTGLPSNTGH